MPFGDVDLRGHTFKGPDLCWEGLLLREDILGHVSGRLVDILNVTCKVAAHGNTATWYR